MLFLAGLGILIFLVVELDVNEILRLIARTGLNFVVILLIYGGCQAARAAAAGVSLAFIRRLRTLAVAAVGLVAIPVLSSGEGKR